MVARRLRGTSVSCNYAVEKGLLVETCIEENLLIPSPRSMTVPSRNVLIRPSIEIGEIGSPVGTSPDAAAAEIETLEEVISGGEYSDSKHSDNKYSDNEHSDSENRLPRQGWRLCLTD